MIEEGRRRVDAGPNEAGAVIRWPRGLQRPRWQEILTDERIRCKYAQSCYARLARLTRRAGRKHDV